MFHGLHPVVTRIQAFKAWAFTCSFSNPRVVPVVMQIQAFQAYFHLTCPPAPTFCHSSFVPFLLHPQKIINQFKLPPPTLNFQLKNPTPW